MKTKNVNRRGAEAQRRKGSLWRSSSDAHYSDEWYTPPQLVQALGKFDLDPCAAAKALEINHAKENWRGIDGLSREWCGRVWCNPPYSQLAAWIEKFIAHGNGIILVNGWPERAWFHRLARQTDAVLCLRSRIKFFRAEKQSWETGCVGQALFAIGKQNVRALHQSKLDGVVMSHLPSLRLCVSAVKKS